MRPLPPLPPRLPRVRAVATVAVAAQPPPWAYAHWRAARFWAMTDGSGKGVKVTVRTAKRHWRAALAAICLAFAAASVHAQTALSADVYTVANVPVDATAASADAARDAARLQGEHRAYTILLTRLTRASDASRLPPANDATLNDLIQGFEVANERHSSVRYL